MVQDITTWGDMKQVVRQLKDDEVKSMFKSIVMDTIDVAGGLCERYICSQAGVDSIGDIPYGQGWTKVKKEFEDTCRTITQLGYALVFISHDKDKTFKGKNGVEYNQTIPTCPSSFNNIAKDMADLYAYAEKYTGDNGEGKVRLIMRSPDNSAETGCRFKYIKPIIDDFNYPNVVEALNAAIDYEAELNGNKYVTDNRETVTQKSTYDYDSSVQKSLRLLKSTLVRVKRFQKLLLTKLNLLI
jgi:hypothetical protein